MPSTYTTNLGIQLPADGELDGTWGAVVNDNMGIIDRAINGSLVLTLTGTTSQLITGDGSTSGVNTYGQYKAIILGGTPSGTHTITISPNDAQKIYFVYNLSGQSVIFSQGSGTSVTIANGGTGIIYTDGAGAGAGVVNLTNNFAMNSVKITGGDITGIADLAIADGGTGASTASAARTNLGLGTIATQNSSSVAITGGSLSGISVTSGSITGITDLAIADGGTGASTAADARTNLGLAIGTNVLAYDANLQAFLNVLNLPTADGTSGQFMTTDGAGNITFTTASSTTAQADSVKLTTSSTASAYKVPFGDTVTSTTGYYGLLQDDTETFTYNPSTNTLTVGSVTGNLTGTASSATTLAGLTASVTELNYTSGVTSAIQTQLNAKANLASPALTGTPTAPTAAVGTSTTQLATTAFVNAEIANDAPTKTGTGASGTWGIDISGNAATATSISGLTASVAELNFTDGVTSNIQTQLDAKQATITGGATTITSTNLTASRALASDASGKVAVSTVTSTELGYLSGVTSAIQTQLTARATLASPTFTGTPAAPTAAVGTNTTQLATTAFVNAEIANDAPTKTGTGASGTWAIDISGNAATASTATTLTGLTATISELNYTAGVTSNIQTQLNAKAPLASPALTGTPTAPTAAVGTNTTQVATTAFVNAEIANDVAVRSAYVSSNQTITSAGLLTLAHGLGQAPKNVYIELICTTADGGWAVNDVVLAYANSVTSGTNRQNSIYYDATNVYVRYSDTGSCFVLGNKTTGASVALTNGSWRLRVRAFA